MRPRISIVRSVRPSVRRYVTLLLFVLLGGFQLKPVAKRHQMVTGSLALLNCFFYCFLYSYFNGSRAAAPVGDEVL